jgi:hypothetical protein
MRKFLLLFFHLLSFAIFAQFNSEFLKYADYRNHVSVYGDYELNSNCINNKFIERFYFGGHIDSTLKQNVSKNLKDQNYFGGGASFGANVFFGSDSSRFDWFVGVKSQEIMNASFSRDLYNTLFYGNEMYKGSTAYFPNTSINYLKFQELKLGFIWKDVDTVGKIGGALSFLRGQNLFQFKTLDTNFLYTAPDASELQYHANFSLAMSDTGQQSLTTMNGIGLSGDLYVETPYKSVLGKSKFIITVNNLGFIRWGKKSIQYSADSLYKFNGYNIKNLFELNDSTLNSISKDSVLNNAVSVRQDYVNVNLPMNFLLIHQTQFTEKYSLRLGVRNIFGGNYRGYFFVDNKFSFNKSLSCGVLLSYGGYGKFSGGVYVEYNYKGQWYLKTGSNSLQGFISPSKTRGQSVYLTLSKKFK